MHTPFSRRLRHHASGFSLVEVLVATLLAGLFFLVVIQASTLSSVNQAHALEASESLTWVQQDLESIRFRFGTYLITQLTSDSVAGSNFLEVQSTADFSDAKTFRIIDPEKPDGTIYTIGSAIGDRINIAAPATGVLKNHPTGTTVVGISDDCAAKVAVDGLANTLRSKLVGQVSGNESVTDILPENQTRTSTNKQFLVYRILTLVQNPPYHRLQIRYVVSPPAATDLPFKDQQGNPRAFVTEVIPDAAFYCS